MRASQPDPRDLEILKLRHTLKLERERARQAEIRAEYFEQAARRAYQLTAIGPRRREGSE
jgi:hypothetical protein